MGKQFVVEFVEFGHRCRVNPCIILKSTFFFAKRGDVFRSTLRSSPSSELVYPKKKMEEVHCFDLLFLHLGCEIMDPCFVHSNESTQKFIWITLKHLQTLFWNRHTVALMIHSKRSIHLADSFFISNYSCKIEITMPCDMPAASTSSRTFTRRSVKTISWTL